jgi:hypothetical protein
MPSIKLPLLERVQPLTFKLPLHEEVLPDTYKLPLHERVYTIIPSKKLPIRETAQVVSIKLPFTEQVWILEGFVIDENIVSWKSNEIILLETIKSFITTQLELIDKNHVKIKWFGEPVPKIQLFRRRIDEDFPISPFAEVLWSPTEYIMVLDGNGYVIKVLGSQSTGESPQVQIGDNMDYDVEMDVSLPLNQKNYYFDLELYSVYRFEVNL